HNKNNELAKLRLPVNLDGLVVLYPQEVDDLVARDGRFRIDLSLHELARVLKINPKSISKKDICEEVDSAAPLFRAVVGKLSPSAKAIARRHRAWQSSEGLPTDGAADEWVTEDFFFTLGALKEPTEKQKDVLAAISRSARQLTSQPGDTIRAIPVEQ